MAGPRPPAAQPRRRHRWLLLLPFGWQVALVPLVDDVALRPFSLPFPMVWQMAGIVFTTIVVGIVFLIDQRLDAAHGPEPEIAAVLDVPPGRPADDSARRSSRSL